MHRYGYVNGCDGLVGDSQGIKGSSKRKVGFGVILKRIFRLEKGFVLGLFIYWVFYDGNQPLFLHLSSPGFRGGGWRSRSGIISTRENYGEEEWPRVERNRCTLWQKQKA